MTRKLLLLSTVSAVIVSLEGCLHFGLPASTSRFYSLDRLAKDSYENGHYVEAKNYAAELQALAPQNKNDWNYGNAIQDYNLVFGRLALHDGNVEAAKNYLLESGKTPGSPQLDTFGPNMSLANDLLSRGEKQVVLDYFDECKAFWSDGQDDLKNWAAQVRAGQTPNFGANLRY